jgi:hypothetical protein
MTSILKLFPFFVLLFLAGGCNPPPESGPPNMMHHVLGALQMQDARERDTALASACREAAEQGSGPVVMMGVPRVHDATLREQVAEECALALGEAGEAEAAADVAKLIASEKKRHEVLAKVNAQ